METTLKLILEVLYCLVALCASGFFVALIYTDFKKEQRDEEIAPPPGRTGRSISPQTDGIL